MTYRTDETHAPLPTRIDHRDVFAYGEARRMAEAERHAAVRAATAWVGHLMLGVWERLHPHAPPAARLG